MSIAKNIKHLRESYKLSQAELGAIAGVSDKAVSTWESGEKIPRMGALQKIADHFHIKKSDIIEEPSTTVSGDEQLSEFMSLFCRLTPEQKNLVVAQIKGILANQ